ncbi:hypothetical protein [Helcococcus kunzii]|uniref:hypothetical protein n=1 Tax=Helcococcus kunzii TaxID=40091 RepID=UPI0038A5C613
MKTYNRVLVLFLSIILFLSATPINSFAASYGNMGLERYDQTLAEVELNYNDMSAKEQAIYWEVVRRDIEKYKKEDPNFDQELFLEQLNQVLVAMDSTGTSVVPQSQMALASIEFAIPNNVVATAVNTAVSLIVGGATSAAIRAYILKKGARVAVNELTKAVVSKLWAVGIKEVTGIGTIIRVVIKNVLDPGSTVAEWLDKRDHKPRNGFVDVKAF